MRIETFILTWNREDTIHLTLKHYLAMGTVKLYDNFSDDRTREIAESMGADVRLFGRAGVLDDGVYLDIKNHEWKKSKADWVIVVDDDEIFGHIAHLYDKRDYTIIKPQGFSVFSNEMPKEDWLELQTGVEDNNYSKLCCFRPDRITDINYVYGCHEARPKGDVNICTDSHMVLMHYRAVGGVERLIKRHREYEPRRQLSPINMRWNLGGHYKETVDHPEKTREWFNENLALSKRLGR